MNPRLDIVRVRTVPLADLSTNGLQWEPVAFNHYLPVVTSSRRPRAGSSTLRLVIKVCRSGLDENGVGDGNTQAIQEAADTDSGGRLRAAAVDEFSLMSWAERTRHG